MHDYSGRRINLCMQGRFGSLEQMQQLTIQINLWEVVIHEAKLLRGALSYLNAISGSLAIKY